MSLRCFEDYCNLTIGRLSCVSVVGDAEACGGQEMVQHFDHLQLYFAEGRRSALLPRRVGYCWRFVAHHFLRYDVGHGSGLFCAAYAHRVAG